MDRAAAQAKLLKVYHNWKKDLKVSPENASEFSPPLLLGVTEEYCRAQTRVLIIGQETFGWDWTSELRTKYPNYKNDWPFADLNSMQDFITNDDAIEALCWGYEQFEFSKPQPIAYRSPFWQAFREVQQWSNVGVMWSNLVRSDYKGGSFLAAPEELREMFVERQSALLKSEIAILRPDVCLMFTGPYYDPILTATFSECNFGPLNDLPLRQIAKLNHPSLPDRTFRTYHPNYLSRSKHWNYIELMRQSANIA